MVLAVGLALLASAAVAEDEAVFRARIEARKERLLSAASDRGRVMTTPEQTALARSNVKSTEWGRKWFAGEKALADYLVSRPETYIDAMVPELTPTSPYGFTCPNCVGRKSQEGVGSSLYEWDYRHPDTIKCRACGQTYPDARFPEEGRIDCPRMGQTLTYYITEAERQHPDDHGGQYAWHWVGMPIRVSFQGIIRHSKAQFAVSSLETLARVYDITGDKRYARVGIRLMTRLARCYRSWLYHDYWATFADCDPLYAAWHDSDLPRDWKRNPSEDAYKKDTAEKASMLQSYWGAGRIHPSTDNISFIALVCGAYDAFRPLMTPDQRSLVAKDLLLEAVMGSEPYVGGEGKASNVTNKSPRVYLAMAAVGKCLDIPEYVETALRGYEGVRDESFLYDGFSRESPAYTQMYLGDLLELTEVLQGYRWPERFGAKRGVVDLYGTDFRLKCMFRAVPDQLTGDGEYLPLSDTVVGARPSRQTVEIGAKRYPEYFSDLYNTHVYSKGSTSYAMSNLDLSGTGKTGPFSPPEVLYPAWMTSILRNGVGPESSVLSMTFNPWGGHRHTDNLGIYYSDRGDAVLDELGYVGDMPTKPWAGNTLSHNLVVVDDSQQINRERVPKFEMMATSPRMSIVEASASAYAQCSDYRRLVALIKGPKGRTFAVDIFRVAGGKKHAYQVRSGLASSEAKDSGLVCPDLSMPAEPPLPHVGNSVKHEDLFGLRDVRTDPAPPAAWQVIWRQYGRSYRLWMLSQVDRVEASNGPGQTLRTNAGRRARYVNAIREGDSLKSTFVAVHEPSGEAGTMPIRSVTRLKAPDSAGPNAVALRIDSEWGAYHIFSEFDQEAEIDGIRFQGRFGAVCDPAKGKPWLMAVGAATLKRGGLGFAGMTARWRGGISQVNGSRLATTTPAPDDWPIQSPGVQSYAAVDDGRYVTGFAARARGDGIDVDRFPVPEAARSFDWLALRYRSD